VAYQLEGHRAVGRQLTRIVTREFDKALKDVSDQPPASWPEAVHKARRRVKKIRAVVGLFRKGLETDHHRLNRQLRTIAHQLSSLRDVDAAVETMEAVRVRYPRLVTRRIFAAVHRGLLAREHGTVMRLHPDRLLPRVARELRRLARFTPPRIRRVAGYPSTRMGMLRAYRRARRAMADVHANPEDVRFHLWRRRVKDHWYHVRLLAGLDRHASARARGLKQLETWLGDDHNLVLLRAAILTAPSRFGDERTTAVVLGCLAKYHATLRRRALALGDRLFAGKPRVFQRSIDGWLRAGTRHAGRSFRVRSR
jgi:CHAD domain-containing protein